MMKRILSGLIVAGALALASLPAQAANIWMCQGDVSGATTGTRTIGGTLSQVPSGTVYVLNGQGCALVASGDVGYFQSQGFTQGSNSFSAVYPVGVATGTTDFVVATLPAGTFIQQIIVANSVAAAVTGGISFGTTANGTDIVTALTCGSSCVTFVADSAMSKRVFSTTAQQAIHAAAVTAWNSTNCTITITYGYF